MEWLERWKEKKYQQYKENPGMWFADLIYYVILSALLAMIGSIGVVFIIWVAAHKAVSFM